MAMFVDPNQRVAVSDDRGNTVYIKAKMDASTRAAVMDEIGAKGLVEGSESEDLEYSNLGSYRLALVLHNVVAWEGPDFADERGKPIPCNRYWIRRWNPDEPIYEKVIAAIGERNRGAEAPDPNSLTPSGSMSAGNESTRVIESTARSADTIR